MLGPHLQVTQRTDPGRDPNKQINEDAFGYQVTRLGHLLVVCDGMGGHAAGQEASQLALRTIVQMIEGAPQGTPPGPALRGAIVQAGRLVYQMGGSGPQAGRPGSTCVAALVHAGGAEIAHVGDSRAYLVRRGQIWQLTKDHSVVQQMIDLGALTPELAASHPEANKITRALGMRPETDVELRDPAFAFEPDDIFVLATDGLCDLVRTDEIGLVITRATSLETAGDELVRRANERGGHDNITVVIARVLAAGTVAAVGPQGAAAPTLVEATAIPGRSPWGTPEGVGLPGVVAGPERTLVDSPARQVEGLATTIPQSVVSPGHPHVAPIAHAVAAPAVPAAVLSVPRAPDPTPMRTHPGGAPSRAGWFALGAGLALFAIILAGVVAWWLLRGPR